MAISSNSFSRTPQAGNDLLTIAEDGANSSLISTVGTNTILTFDVMANDAGGNAKRLWSVDDESGFGGLSTSDIGRDWEAVTNALTTPGIRMKIVDGMVQLDLTGALAQYGGSVQGMGEGDTITGTFFYTIRLGNGTLSRAEATFTINGTNDVPVATLATNAVTEDGSVSGTVTATDADAGETAGLTYALTAAAPTGLTFNANGSYTFDASSYDSLTAGQKLDVVVSFTASDATSTSAPQTLTITLTGTNDIPVATAAVGSVTEDTTLSGTVTATDADAGETAGLTYALTTAAPTGLTFNPDGSYTFDASSYDSLPEGEELVLTVEFTASDAYGASEPKTLKITVTGTNDIPVATAGTLDCAEDAGLTGSVSATDADEGETATLTYALVYPDNAPVGLTFNADGTYQFEASSYDSLTAGEQKDITVSFTASDATSTSAPKTLTITLTGTNDIPVATAAVGSVTEDASVSGTVTATDADEGETAGLTYALTAAAPTGLTFNADGSYTFDASSYDSLPEGEQKDITVEFTASDATSTSAPQTLTITITGTNDAAIISGTTSGSVTEDATLTATGTLTADDVDGADTFNALSNVAGTYGTFSIGTNGAWTYLLTNTAANVQALNTGAVKTDSFTVSTADGTSQLVSITVYGANEAPPPPPPSDPNTTGTNLSGTDAGNTLSGLAGNDTISGLGGNDIINGNGGADSLLGGGGDDSLFGGDGNDTLYGNENADNLFGGNGNDMLYGGQQVDRLTGGAGDDSLYGDAQADTFIFTAGDNGVDTIFDFTRSGGSADKIDLTAVYDNPATTTIDEALLFTSGPQARSVWYTVAGGSSTVFVDTDGITSTIELSFRVDGVTTLSASDFLL